MEKRGIVAGLILVVLVALAAFAMVQNREKTSDIAVRSGKSRLESLPSTSGDHKFTVYLITMDQGSNYWKQIDDGCRQAAKELGNIRYKWLAPANHTDAEQAECVDKAVNDRADAIIISAISPDGINASLKRASDNGTKIIYVDNGALHAGVATLITDNEVAGSMAGKTMLEALKKAGITSGIIGLGANKVARNGILRDKGFRDVFKGTAFTVAPTVTLDGNPENIKNMVREHPEYVGFFGANEQITRALSEAVEAEGTKQIIVGFDTSDFTLSMIKKGVIYATMQQAPKKMGYDGLMIAVQALEGKYTEPPGKVIDMGVNVITQDKI